MAFNIDLISSEIFTTFPENFPSFEKLFAETQSSLTFILWKQKSDNKIKSFIARRRISKSNYIITKRDSRSENDKSM